MGWSVHCLCRSRPDIAHPAMTFTPVDLLDATAFEAALIGFARSVAAELAPRRDQGQLHFPGHHRHSDAHGSVAGGRASANPAVRAVRVTPEGCGADGISVVRRGGQPDGSEYGGLWRRLSRRHRSKHDFDEKGTWFGDARAQGP